MRNIEGKSGLSRLSKNKNPSELLNKYPNSTGRNYFEQYIEHHMTKMKIKDNSKEISKDDEGR